MPSSNWPIRRRRISFIWAAKTFRSARRWEFQSPRSTIVDDTQKPGVFGFRSSNLYRDERQRAIHAVLRSNGVAGSISMRYSTINSNSTAVVGTDYTGLTNAGPLVFNQGVVSNGFSVTVKNNGIIYTNIQEKTVFLALSQLGNSPPGATYGISNAMLRLINPNYQGYLTLTATNYNGNESSGFHRLCRQSRCRQPGQRFRAICHHQRPFGTEWKWITPAPPTP